MIYILFNYKINKQTKKYKYKYNDIQYHVKVAANLHSLLNCTYTEEPSLNTVKLLYGEILLLTSIQIINYQKM